MKKSLLTVAFCCIVMLFASCKKEAANEKFIGTYNGQATFSATIIATGIGEIPSTRTAEISMSIAAGDADNRVVATITTVGEEETEPFVINGTVEGTKIDFDDYNRTETAEGTTITAEGDFVATLNGNVLTLDGELEGFGTIAMEELPMPIPITVKGTITGDLNKVQ